MFVHVLYKDTQKIVHKIPVSFQEQQIIIQNIFWSASLWEEGEFNAWICAALELSSTTNYLIIIVQQFTWIATIGIIRTRGNSVEISIQARFLQKARKFIKIPLQ